MNARDIRVGAALLAIAWAIVQIEGRRSRAARDALSPPHPDPDGEPPSGEQIERGYQVLAQLESQVRSQRDFRLHMDERVADGIRRIARGQIEEALDRLEGRTEEDFGTAVHESRKSLKRLRAIVRLVRDEIGEKAYKRENACFREVGRALSGPRDSRVLIEALDSLAEHNAGDEPDVAAFRASLERAHEAVEAELSAGAPLLAELAAELRAAEERVAEWRLRRRGFRIVSPGLERAYRRGRRAYRAALDDPSPEHLHEWRKRVKDLWYSAQILEAAAPRRMKKLARAAHELSDLLGEDHDLVLLEERAREEGTRLQGGAAVALRTMAERRRGELQARAFAMGPDVYGKRPAAFVSRIERGWRKRR